MSDGIVVFSGGNSFTTLDDMRFVGYGPGLDLEPSFTYTISPELSDVHQIAYANGGLYVANSRYNSIVFQALDGANATAFISMTYMKTITMLTRSIPVGIRFLLYFITEVSVRVRWSFCGMMYKLDLALKRS